MLLNTPLSRQIRLRHLRCFVAVSRQRSFVLAADTLGLTQPAISRSIRELEEILGHRLFDRSSHGAHLTDRGRIFLASAETGLLQILQGAQSVAGSQTPLKPITIGALPNVCSQFLPGVIQRFKQQEPDARIHIVPGANSDLLGRLRQGETDFVIGRLSSSDDMKGLLFEALYDEPLVFMVRSKHPLAKGYVTLRDALDFPLLLPPEGTIIRQEVSRFFAARGVSEPQNVIETTSSEFQRTYLAETDAVAVLPRGVLQLDLDQGSIVMLDISGDELVGPVGLTTNPAKELSEAAKALLAHIRTA